MTPKEKAENLIWKYLTSRDINGWDDVRDVHAAIRCALIAVDEMINVIKDLDNWAYTYYIEVKQEIEKL